MITVNPGLFPISQGREALLLPHPTLTPTPDCCLTVHFPAMWELSCKLVSLSFAAVLVAPWKTVFCLFLIFILMEQFTSQLKAHNSAYGW